MNKTKIMFVDFIKGIAAMMVVLHHLPETPKLYNALLSFVMIPLFFFASGYLTKVPEKHILRDYLYKRVGKLLVLYVLYMFIIEFTSITEIKQIIADPSIIIEKIMEAAIEIVVGKGFWFVSCLIVVNIIFMFIVLASRRNNIFLFVFSMVICALGVVISDARMMPWNFDTAMVCQFIFVTGYMIKEYHVAEKIKNKKLLCVSAFGLYSIIIIVGSYCWGLDSIMMNFALNSWGVWFVSIPAIIFGVTAITLMGDLLNGVKFVDYIGAHSLIYFAFASHGGSIMNKIFEKLAVITNCSVFSNRYLINPLSCVIGCLLMIIPCLFIDRFIPFFNGKFQMPLLGNKKRQCND